MELKVAKNFEEWKKDNPQAFVDRGYPYPKQQLEILVLLFYYDRPEMVKNALDSLNKQTYRNFKVVVIDDGSENAFTDVFPTMIGTSDIHKYTIVNTHDSPEDKQTQGGSMMGKAANQAMERYDSDIVVMLCDDDAMMPEYLENLNTFFTNNPEANHCHSKVKFYNPTKESYLEAKQTTDYRHMGSTYNTLNKAGAVVCEGFDASQVAWRNKLDVKFPFPQTRNHDAYIYKQLREHGLCYATGTFGQAKGAFDDQLGNRYRDGKGQYNIKNK
jgi:glycosyltransferase involved in cell wall biosynthesis